MSDLFLLTHILALFLEKCGIQHHQTVLYGLKSEANVDIP